MKTITSRNNETITAVSKLKDKKYRDEARLYTVEGRKLWEEALLCNAPIQNIFVTEKFLKSHHELCESDIVTEVSETVFEKLTTEKAPEGIMCTVKYDDVLHGNRIDGTENGSVFILCSVRDPGNLGTVMRTAAAFGIDTLLMSCDCADIYGNKVSRASMGAIFRQRTVISNDIISDIEYLKSHGKKVYAAVLDINAFEVQDINIDENLCFAVGNEGTGIPKDIVSHCSGTVFIPMEAGAESLNASVAASLLIWEQYRFKIKHSKGI